MEITIPAGAKPSPALAEFVRQFNRLNGAAQRRVAAAVTRQAVDR